MLVSVRLFALARVRAGRSVIELSLPDGACVAELKAALGAAVPSLTPLLPSIRISMNAEYSDDATPIVPGAELAAIPPVSGGLEDAPR